MRNSVLKRTDRQTERKVHLLSCASQLKIHKVNISGENPLVATDARCFMPWIASQYNMKLEKDYTERLNCQNGRGDIKDADQEIC